MSAGLKCGSAIIKYFLFFFNFVCVLAGIALIAVGALSLKAASSLSGGVLNSALILVVIVGSIIFVISFYGCCGAIKESHCMLITYAVLLLTLVILEIVIVVLLFQAGGSASSGIREVVEDTFKKAKENNDATSIAATDAIQSTFSCCGLSGPAFWNTIPDSCYASSTHSTDTLYETGCEDKYVGVLTTFGKSLGAVAIIIAIVEVFGIWFALSLAGTIKSLTRGRR